MTAHNLGSVGAVPSPGTGPLPTAHLQVAGVTASYGGQLVLHGVELASADTYRMMKRAVWLTRPTRNFGHW